MYQESFIRNNPAKFVDTAWVNVDDLKVFLSAREVHLNIYASYDLFLTRERKNLWRMSVTVSRVPDASQAIKKERVASPDLVVKSEPVLVNIEIHDPPNPRLYHSTVTEDVEKMVEKFWSYFRAMTKWRLIYLRWNLTRA